MKYVVVLGDGMADWPIEALGGETPLSAAKTPAMDALAKRSEIGTVATIPEGWLPEAIQPIFLFWAMIPGNIIPAFPAGGFKYRRRDEGYGCGVPLQPGYLIGRGCPL